MTGIDPVTQIREDLKIARNQSRDDSSQTIDGTSANTEGISGSDVRSEQSIFADLFRSSSEDDTANESYDDSQRSTNEISIGVGRTDRRSSKNSSSTSDRTETIRGTKRRAGRLVADDPIPIREKPKSSNANARTRGTPVEETDSGKSISKEEKNISVQRGKASSKIGSTVDEGKTEKQGFKLPSFKEGTTLSIAEAKALESPLLSALEADFGYIDQYIWYRTKDVSQAPIWSDMDNEDLQILCNILLKRSQKSPAAAATVRAIVNGSTYVDVAMLMAPRFIKTVQVLKNAPKIERPGFMERKRIVRENA